MIDEQALRERVNSFPRWHYEFHLGPVTTPIFDRDHVNRHRERRAHLFGPLLSVCGGSLAGKTVLDLGCNAGYWSLQAIEAGCDRVVGVDGRAMHVEQANLVFEALGVPRERYHFVEGRVAEVDLGSFDRFDVVLCLGLLYHVCKPVELFEWMSALNGDVLVVDTALSMARGSWLQVTRDSLDNPSSAVDRELVFFPSREAVLDLAEESGYSAVVLRPRIGNVVGMRDYTLGYRRAFLCAKETKLDGVDQDRRTTPGAAGRVAGRASWTIRQAWRLARGGDR